MEIWKDVVGYIGLYMVSSHGRIKSLKKIYGNNGYYQEKILKPGKLKSGHLFVYLYNNKKQKSAYIHRLVLETFIGPCPKGMECRHLDGNSSNNRLDNLKWGTSKENSQDSIDHGTFSKGFKSGRTKLNKSKILKSKKLLKEGKLTQIEIAKIIGVSNGTISLIKSGKIWQDVI